MWRDHDLCDCRSALRNGLGLPLLFIVALSSQDATAQDSYSPTVHRTYPDNVFWGDTHLHTYLSGDAYGLGTLLTPDDAYRFAKGETIRATGGEQVRLQRPLDFLMVADHAENLGVLPRLIAGDPALLATEDGRRFAAILTELPPLPGVVKAESLDEYNRGSKALGVAKGAWNGDYGIDENFKRQVWHEVVDVAEKHNDPGKFTTFAGFEWSSNPPMLHRNVLFAGSAEQTRQILPFSKFDSYDVEDLWSHLQEYQDRVGSELIAIPHNSNLSGGQMFSPLNFQGDPLTASYVRTRAEMEPITEVTQIKGDSETHPLVSPDDEFADYETWGKAPADGAIAWAEQSYARSALKLGLGHAADLGANPFKFGMIGSTDSHTGLATADEDNFWGKMGANEPGPYRALTLSVFTSSGYAAVWAHENTRASLFAALKRREVYASTGPRITLRFFGGWDYAAADASSPELAAIGYRSGVPMGGDLTLGSEGTAPSFLVRAVKDPNGANLDRVQIIKGWRDGNGELMEEVHDVAWSDARKVGPDGKLPSVGATVNLTDASYRNSIGAAELSVTWIDPHFDAEEAAFYYVRVIQIPTPRWTSYDAAFYGLKDLPEEIPRVTQERAYSSPIWYTPQ
jgi:hypothetical protein|tara:strand:+ start:2830 stop:4707 length:1878 start_codon:yes stop_codon:yes gene_type:complete